MNLLTATLRFLVRLLFRFRAYGVESLKTPGPVLLIPNHCSWLDWVFIGVCLDGDWRFVTSSVVAETSPLHRFIMKNRRTFAIDTNSPYALKRMAEYLEGGGRLVLFAEGRITDTGSLMKLFDGTGFLIHKTRAKVITCHLRGATRIGLARQPGWRNWFHPVSAHFSPALTAPHLDHPSASESRRLTSDWLRDCMTTQHFEVEMEFGAKTVPAALREMARNIPGRVILEDFTLKPITYRRMFVGAQLLAERIAGKLSPDSGSARPVGGDASPHVGVLLPNTNALPLTLLALWSLGRVPAILNYTTGPAMMLVCARLAGLKTIVTSRSFLARAKLDVKPLTDAGIEFVYLEDLRKKITGAARVTAMLRAVLTGLPDLAHPFTAADDTAVVLFTSGSEGVPKGVQLSHRNLLANYRQMLAVTDIEDSDRLFNALPLFHSFGLVVGTFLGLLRGCFVFLYPSPLHYRVVPSIVYDRRCTILLGTNTFLNGYARKAHPYDFRRVRYLFAAAEKVQTATFDTWARRFGIRILEGYGATETGPALSVNTPMLPKFGSAGRLLPGIEWRVEPVEGVDESADPSAAGEVKPHHVLNGHGPLRTGRLFVKGPNIMKGYLNADANAVFQSHGGWYDTGDIVRVDEEGYLHILGRMKRFAKVSGEMVSLTAVEDALAGAFPQHGLRCQCAVVARPDEDKGEKLIAVTNEPKLTLDDIRAAVKARGLSNLCVPREILVVREIPKLGTGKTNHRELEKMLKT
jgi:acyl-[acyl-carrier-protein]-phospholipid O-acyltransferase/long-chain-fatty-acid--[acyl-carrier-protein] ligase